MSQPNVEDIYPLAPAQQGMLLYLLFSGLRSEVYFDQYVATLEGRLDLAAWRQAWEKVVERHAALRTLFLWERRDQPLQIVRRSVELPWREEDLRGLPEPEREARVAALLREDHAQGFDLKQAPLTRCAVLRLTDDSYRFVWSFSHLVLDGWSMAIVLADVLALYRALAGGEEPRLPRPRPYRAFIDWLVRQDVARAESFWRRSLAGVSAPTPLPGDGTGTGGELSGWVVAEERLALPRATVSGLQELGRRHQVTLNTLLQAAWGLLLGRHAGSDDVLFGGIVSGRPAEVDGVESMVGLFINGLPVRVRFDSERRLGPFLRDLQEVQIEQREYEYCPLEQVQVWSEVERHVPLFGSMLVFENYPVDALAGGGDLGFAIRFSHLAEAGNYPLTLYVNPGRDRLELKISYHWTRFSAAAIRPLLHRLGTLLASFVAHPEGRLDELSLLDAGERRELLALGAGPVRPAGGDTCIHHLVAEQAARTPGALAVVETAAGERSLTYAELDAHAARLARQLRELGVGPEVVVGLAVERSLAMLVGMLGVLKAGGAYLPLDPAYPRERLEFMLTDSGARVVLTEERLAARLPAAAEMAARLVLLDDFSSAEMPPLPVFPEPGPALPHHPAYVIYTSGSTGRPKGVLVPHAALVNYVRGAAAEYALMTADRVLQFASISFDTSAEEIYPCLTRGATLVLRDEATVASLAGFARGLKERRITVLDLPTAYWHELVAEMSGNAAVELPESLRLVILGGELALADRLAQWRRRVGGSVRLVNTYGPTEATIVSTKLEVASALPEGSAGVPIGRAVPGARTYLLGSDRELVPAGAEGELYIGGAGLARGYLGRPELTAERFGPNPFAPEDGAGPGERLYRTGDRARLLPDGNLEFRGRADDQVKVRGFRIELGEIEAALRRLAAVRDAVVAARDAGPGEKRLVAYVVAAPAGTAGTAAPQPAELRAALKESLPEHMIPAAFVLLEALPLTPSGKVDRRALPEPDAARPDLAPGYAAPRNPVQEVLAGIWSELLGVERVGVEDDFFELGGHSLLVAKLAARVRQVFGVELSMVEVFKKPTVAELAEAVERAERGQGGTELPDLPPIERASRDRPIPLSFPQERVWFLNQLTPGGNIAYNFQFTLWLRGELDAVALGAALDEIVRRHEVLRTSFPALEGRPVQVIHPPYAVELPEVDLRALPAAALAEESERLVFESTQKPFDVTRIPLLRWRLLRLADDYHELIQVEQHFVHDGWSFGVFLRELKTLYAAFAAGFPSPLPELPIQYADFAAWQRGWMDGPAMEQMMSYWRKKLAGSSTVLELPTDRPRPSRATFKGDITLHPFPPALYEGLRRFGRGQGFTLYMTMLSGFFSLLSRYTGQDDILLGTNNANRRARETEGLIGMIVNSLLIRGDLTGNPGFRDLLGRVRETSLENYAYQDTPFERLVQELRPERQMGRNPLFQVMFNFHDAAIPDLDFGGLSGWFRVRGNRSAKMDMNVIMVPRAEQRVGLAASAADRHSVLHWEYSSDLFDFATIKRMIGHYETLLAGAIANPALHLSELPLLTAPERRQLLADWNDTATELPAVACFHELFEEQAACSPGAPAVSFQGVSLTYGELDGRADRLARHLRRLGVGPEVLVGVAVERSLDLLVALLAVLKAGGAYLPLDPGHPRDRLAYILEDSGAPLLLVGRVLEDGLPECRARLVPLDEIPESAAESGPPVSLAGPESPAYVIYTSGSTGRPKGVVVPHRAVVNFLASMARRPGLGAADVLVAVTTVSFDIAALELFLPLAVGARVEIADRATAADGVLLAALLGTAGATVLQATPATWRVLLESGWQGREGLKALCGGEALPGDLARELLSRVGDSGSLWNVYGPTETTIWSALLPVDGAAAARLTVPIGRPLDNTSLHLLDRDLEPVPAGVAGELLIGGLGLARGYLGRPDLTAERFVPDRFGGLDGIGGIGGARLYRTGDLARFLADGSVEFLGRFDHQVKVRGFRIEPAEIEAVLLRQPGVGEAVVVAREDRPGDRRLVAYVVGEPTAAELREALAAELPLYMIPATFVALDRLPRTANGKVDRRALPAPETGRPDAEVAYVAPRTPVETTLAAIWSSVLGIERVGALDDFFALGGHSLSATSVLSRVRDTLAVELPLSVVFERRTVEGMAAAVAAGSLAAAAAKAAEAELAERVAALSDVELDALLGEMIGERGRA